MDTMAIIVKAIQTRKPISYEYVGGKKPVYGERRGDPYAIYVYTDSKGNSSTKVDIFQISGASSSGRYDQVKMSDLKDFRNVKILDNEPEFAVSPLSGYNPESDRYGSVIEKV